MNIKSSRIGIAVAIVAMTWGASAHAQSYAFTALGSLGGTIDEAHAINSLGQVAGYSTDADGVRQAVVWTGAVPTVLNSAGSSSVALGINSSGSVAGFIAPTNFANGVPTVWSAGNATSFGTLNGDSTSATPLAINDAGVLAGYAMDTGGNAVAVIWHGSTPTVLNGLGGAYSQASAINNAGQVAGAAAGADGLMHTVVWNGTTPTALGEIGGPGGYGSVGTAISNSGLVAGFVMDSSFQDHAVAWGIDGTPTALADLSSNNAALGINSSGQVVGSFTVSDDNGGKFFAALWDASTGTGVDLNSFLSASLIDEGYVLTMANAINDQGQITGDYINNLTGQSGAFVLTPVPEPGTYALFLLGLSGVGLVARRRQASKA